MNRTLTSMIAVLLCASLVGSARAQQEPVTLKVGDAAPALAGGKWVRPDGYNPDCVLAFPRSLTTFALTGSVCSSKLRSCKLAG